MRTTIVILIVSFLISCNDNEQKTVSKNDRFELIPEPDKDLREEYEQQQIESISTDTIHEDFLEENLKPIIENLKKINGIKEWSSIDKRKLNETTKSDSATYYFFRNILSKIIVIHYEEKDKTIQEYYTLNNELSFVFEKTYNYSQPVTFDSSDMTENNNQEVTEVNKSEVIEDRNYFEKGVLIRQINNQDCGSPFTEEYLKEEQTRLSSKFQELLNLIKE